MRRLPELIEFLSHTMSMTEVYQPVIVRYLLEQGGNASKADLARVLSGYDKSVQDYYQTILMRWPKITLTKHKVVLYRPKEKVFTLNFELSSPSLVDEAKVICEQKIADWIKKQEAKEDPSGRVSSKRYRVLKAAKGKCELCGISAKIAPIDIDHIVPQNKADKNSRVFKDGIWIHVDDEQNLQALCFRCNRAKRDTDSTDFRLPSKKLVRDRIPEIISQAGRTPLLNIIRGDGLLDKLFEKLTEEHVELIADKNIEEVVDVIEVLFAIARSLGYSEEDTMRQLNEKRIARGGFTKGFYLEGVI